MREGEAAPFERARKGDERRTWNRMREREHYDKERPHQKPHPTPHPISHSGNKVCLGMISPTFRVEAGQGTPKERAKEGVGGVPVFAQTN